jgi:hypothetical protein
VLKPFREFAHKLGLTAGAGQGRRAVRPRPRRGERAKSREEVDDLQKQLGPDYEPKRAAAKQVSQQLFGDGIDAALIAQQFDRAVGNSATFLKG